ncbi:hypothetical protein BH24DEI2_BH24DEI2_17860 [soil metagenome]
MKPERVCSYRGLTFWFVLIVGVPLTIYGSVRGIPLFLSGRLDWSDVVSFIVFPIGMFWFAITSFKYLPVEF